MFVGLFGENLLAEGGGELFTGECPGWIVWGCVPISMQNYKSLNAVVIYATHVNTQTHTHRHRETNRQPTLNVSIFPQ